MYEGIDLRSNSVVAIKALFPNKAKDEFMLRRFKEEANHYLLLEHENLPKLVDFVIEKDKMYLIMEYVNGIDMSKFLQTNGPLDDDMTIHFFSMILDTIGYLHKQGILHLDIKPSNIMITENLGIKVLDLGIAAMVSEGDSLKKKCGSPSFMAPEQINGEKLGFYTDIFQIGVTLYNMITGHLPFGGATQQEIFSNICNNPTPQLLANNSTANQALQAVIDRALQKNGSDRFASCAVFKNELLNALSEDVEGETESESEPEPKDTINEIKEVKNIGTNKHMKIITVGREIGNDIVIPDTFVGRHHLEIIQDEAGSFFLHDLDSRNGTFVNGQRITGEVPLDVHDIVRIGNTTLPWISYFLSSDETEVEEEKPKRKKKRKKKTPEEKQARKEKFKKSMGGAGKWIARTMLAILTSLLMMYIFTKMRGKF